MLDFSVCIPTRIHFGRNALDRLAGEVRLTGGPVLLVTGGASLRRSGLYAQITEILKECGVSVYEVSGIKPNPVLEPVYSGIALCREHGVKLVLAAGGGSVIDTAKAIASGACFDGDVWDLHCGRGQNDHALPLGTILTLAAAGSEMSNSCVLTNEKEHCKRGRSSQFNYPVFSILNPEWTYTLPPYQTACGAADIMAHMMERYFSADGPSELTDRMIEGSVITVMNNVKKALAVPDDYEARAQLMWAGSLAHNGLMNTGRMGDWSVHKLEHELSAWYDIAHGGGLAVMYPSWIRYVSTHGKTEMTARFAVRVLGVPEDFGTPEETALEGAARLDAFYHDIGLTTTLHENGIGSEHIQEMAASAALLGGGKAGKYLPLDAAACEEIYRMAL